jgi:hypothetical protein
MAAPINGQLAVGIKGAVAVEIDGTINITLAPPQADIVAVVTTKFSGISLRAQGDHMAYTLPSVMQIEVGVQYQDAAGNAATVDGAVAWASSDATIIAITPAATPPAGYPTNGVVMVQSVGPTGQAQVTATADADLGTGMKSITTLLDVTVIAGEAVAGVIAPIGDPSPVNVK